MPCDYLDGWEGVGGGREFQEGGDIYVPSLKKKVLSNPYPSIRIQMRGKYLSRS